MESRLRKIIVCDPDRCNGCRICEYVCSFSSEGVLNIKKSRIRVVRIEPFVNIAVTCRKCEDPPCVKACPRDALKQKPNGIIVVDENKCNGCGWCIEVCPFGVVRLHLDKRKIVICDYCEKHGSLKCVEYCPKDALKYVTLDQAGKELSKKAVKTLLEEVTAERRMV
ncbi:MAG: 4Fe-4S dicluster domain-containing protein [Thermoproteota archaeon]